MFYPLIEVLASFVEILFLFCIFDMFLIKRIDGKNHCFALIALCAAMTLLTTYLNSIVLYSYGTLTIWIIASTLLGYLLYKCNPIKICSISVLYIVIISSIDFLFMAFAEYILNMTEFIASVLNGNSIERVIFIVTSKLLLALAYFVIKSKKLKLSLSLFTSIMIIVFGVLSFASMQYTVATYFTTTQENVKTVILVTFSYMSLFFILLLIILNSHEKLKATTAENDLIEEKLKLTEERNKRIIETYREIARLSHDHSNQLKVVHRLLADGNPSAAQEYLSDIVNSNTDHSFSYTGIHSIDAVLSQKNRFSKDNNIEIDLDVAITSLHGIKEIDICTVLLNLLDNAVEACLKIDEAYKRSIKVVFKNVNSMVFIKIENSVANKPLYDDNAVGITTKKNKEQHGYGLLIVNSIANKYNGSLLIKNENNVYMASLLLSN